MIEFFCEIQEPEQLSEYLCSNSALILNPYDFTYKNIDIFIKTALNYNTQSRIYLNLPVFAKAADVNVIKKTVTEKKRDLSGLTVNNVYGIQIASQSDLRVMLGQGMTVTNDGIPKKLGAEDFIYSPQLSSKDIRLIKGTGIVFAYGYLKLMTMAHCPLKAAKAGSCKNCTGGTELIYSDRFADFKIIRQKIDGCTFDLYNTVRHNIIEEAKTLSSKLYFNMLGHNKDEITEILKNPSGLSGDFTKGNIKRGVS